MSLTLSAQVPDSAYIKSVFSEYKTLVKGGRLKEAVSCLSGLLNSKIHLNPKEKLSILNSLGIQNKNLGQFDSALKYYDQAESLYVTNNSSDNSSLVSIYGNKGNIYAIKGDFNKALEYCEKAIRTVDVSNRTPLSKMQTTATLNLSIGIAHYQLSDYKKALSAFQKSISIKEKYKFSGKDFVYQHIANTYARMRNNPLADKYYNLGILQSEAETKFFSTNLVNIYLEYGHFLLSIKENAKALKPIQKALNLSIKNIGEKSQLTSNCFQLMGDYYRLMKDYPNALIHYQKTLISCSNGFNESKIEANPLINQITNDLWQLRVLQRKAEVLAKLGDEINDRSSKINYYTLSLNTLSLAIEMTNMIRVDYQAEETRLMFNEKQKNVFVEAIETNLKMYDLTLEKRYLHLAYQTAQQSKANELKYEIARNKSFSNKEIPESLREKEKEIQSDFAAYSLLIHDESALPVPDTSKIAYWKDQQFDLRRRLEKTVQTIEQDYPRFTDKLKRGNIITIETIQAGLKPDDTLIEYVFSDRDLVGNRKLYQFVMTPTDLVCHTEQIDSTLSAEISGLQTQLLDQLAGINSVAKYNQMNQRLFMAYTVLIQPIEKYFKGKQLIIIPDEELSYLPFDAFLTKWVAKTRINYAELAYLIHDYTISYGYSTNTLWINATRAEICPEVIGFAPDYENIKGKDGVALSSLKNNNKEIARILTNFSGSVYKGGDATITNFRTILNNNAILHLAMHAELDTTQAGSSSLIFNLDNKNPNNFRLSNFEIGQMSIKSPMVVLSACNTGNGRLYSGEGLMSLARNFVLAGVPSVVETLWPVEDVAGSKIMGDFYKYLADGRPKNTAMRLAKLDYINTTSPSFINPGYWAAYTLMGDTTPIKKCWWKEPWIVVILVLSTLILFALLVYRLRSFRMSRAFFL
jgi:CHAT domain-containing protein